MLIRVTDRDMKYGWLYTNNRHPICLAIKRHTGLDSVVHNCSVDLLHNTGVETIDFDDATMKWMDQLERDYESGRLTDIHEFELEIQGAERYAEI